jgi:hypothetical protein
MRSIEEVFRIFRDHLDDKKKEIVCFSTYQFQVEGWLKGEFVFLLDKMKAVRQIINFDREVTAIGRKKVDLVVELENGRHWIELKHWLIGEQKGQKWRSNSYISELENEIEKLKAIKAGKRGWIAVLCTKNPGIKDFDYAVDRFNRDYAPCKLSVKDSPSNYPEAYYFGVINVLGI